MRKFYHLLLGGLLLLLAGAASAQTITITAPNGGNNWNGCTNQNITWTTSGIAQPYFDIYYSPDNGSNWVAIASNYFSPGGTYSWTLPNITSSNFLVRVVLSSNGAVLDVSDAVFTVTGPLILTSPNGGQSWVAGTTQTITWTPNGTSNNYKLEYSTNNGASWITIVNPLSTTGNTYNWTIPNTPSNNCRVRISDNGDPTCKVDVSDAPFYILSSITVTQPNGGQMWTATVGSQGVAVNMDNVTVTANTGNFYDNGGSGGNYSTSQNLTKTFFPDVGTNKLRFTFTAFQTYNTNDYLRIYNGPTTGSPLIGTYNGTNMPPVVTSTHSTGALTFQFVSSSGFTQAGWEAYFQSVGTPTQNINWSITGTSGKFNLDYSTNNGTNWIRIVSGMPSSTGTFAWNVPNTPSTNCLVKVTDAGNGAILDQSDATFTIGQANPLLLAPNGGETWYAGTVQNITWVPAFFTSGNVKLEYSTDNGTTWTTIISSTPNASGGYAWTVLNTPSNTSLVRVSDASNGAINDVSNTVFTIAPHVTVTAPNGGQNWTGCSTQNITWLHGGTSGLFNLEYSTDNGTTWVTIVNNHNGGAGPSASYAWQVPNIGSVQALVRITDAGDPLKTDVSNAVFTMAQTTNIVLLTPNGNENWVTGTSQAITYSVGGGVTNVRLEYSTNNGLTWTTIINSTSGGVYNWTIPNTPSVNCLVRATDTGNSCNSDVSNSNFVIVSQVTVNVPNGGEVWQATVGNQGIAYNMDNVPVTMNTGNFYDPGGISGNYAYTGSTSSFKTFTPDVPTNKLRVTFNSFTTINSSDYLRVYNGPSNAFPLLATLSGTTSGNTYTSTHSSGALTFEWRASSGSVTTGWEAQITSIGTATQTVNWSIIGTSQNYNLDYSTNGGTSWIRILTNYPSSTGNFTWQVPNTPTTQARFRVMDYQNNTIVDQSDANFTIGQAAAMLVTPNGGETWYAGTAQNITWVSMFNPGLNVKLEYSTDAGSTWTTITNSTPNTGSYAWTVPNTPSITSRVRVSDASNPLVNDVSNANFTIAPHVTVTAPNGGQNWNGCAMQNITWNHGGTSGLFDIDYSTDNGVTWIPIANAYNGGAGPSASYSWQVPNIGSTQALVRVTDDTDALKTDQSNSVFTITQTNYVNVVSPNGGQVWIAGTSQAITYSTSGPVTSVRIEYSTNNGISWTTMVSGHTGGTYVWTVPNVNTNQALIRVSDNSNNCISDVSDATFNLLSQITVNAPNGGEVWQATVGNQGLVYVMDNVPVTMNTGNFYDPGGISGNYSYTGSTSSFKTFTPDIPTNKLRVTFNSMSTINSSDYIRVYNGPSNGFPILGTLSGSSTGTYTSTHSSGALTFEWRAASGSVSSGFEAQIVSVGTPTQAVNWSIIGTSQTFNLDYSTNNGTSWTRILTNYPSSTGTFAWSVPNTPSTNCRFRVQDYQNNAIVDQSDAVFTIGTASPILVTPNGGENWYAGTTQTISWVSMFMPNPTVKLEYSTDGGTTWLSITNSAPNTGTYTWTIPNAPTSTARVRISDTVNPLVNDMSNNNFTISPYVTVTGPNGGQTWLGCAVQSISFNHGGTSGLFNLEYSTDNGTTWATIVNNFNGGAGPAASYSWTVPNVSTTQALVRVTDASDNLKTDVSNSTFTINQTSNVQLLTPNGGEVWVANTTQNINYSVGGGVTTVRLEYSTNNGSSWTTIISSHTGGTYVWTIPNVNSTVALVRVVDASNSCNSDQSNATFNLVSQITVNQPNGGEVWQATVGTQGIAYNMDNTPVTLNTANFYDPGGISGNYSYTGSTSSFKTFTPDIPTNKLRVTFNSMSTINSSDYIRVYNGPSNAFPILGTLSGSSTGTFTSTHATGSLTFEWRAASGSVSAGFEAQITSVGTPAQNVNWSIIGTSQTFNLEYTTNNGTNWSRILTNYPSTTGTFAWQVPNTPSTNCRFRVMDYQNNAIVDQSDAVFTIGAASALLVTPNGGENWYAGTSQTISWVSMFMPSPTVKLEYSTDAGSTWTVITNSTPNTGSYNWFIPNTPSTQARVRVTDTGNPLLTDMSNANFTLWPYVTVMNPNGGQNWLVCSVQSIQWNHGGTTGLFNLEYSADNGVTWNTIVNNYNGGAGPSSSYSWTIPNISSSTVLVRVTDAGDNLKTDVSNAAFTIIPTNNVIMLTPNGGEVWVAGTTQPITYSLGGGVTTVRLEYSTNNGISWNTIISSTSGGVYNWTIPNVNSCSTLVRAVDTGNSCNFDASNGVLCLLSQIAVTAPNGGEVWQATVGQQGLTYVMDNTPVTMNTGNLYDPGGISGNYTYTGSTSMFKTFTPDIPTNKLRVIFNSMSTINSSDYVRVYNGPSNAFPILGTLSGTNVGVYTSTHSTGALTFEWRAASGSVSSGFEAQINSIGTATRNVTWTITGTSQTYNLEYTTNDGTSWTRILTNYPSTTGLYQWQVPNTPSTNCRFRVRDYQNNAIVDQSDALFTIGQASQLLVTPNGGETWYAGTTQNITWVSMFNPSPNVKLEYSTDNGTTWLTIINSTPNTGSYPWTLPNTPSTQTLVRVSDAVTTTFNDVSNAVFTIAPHVTLTSPNGGNTFNGCQTTNIIWTHGGTSGLFDLHYSTDNGTSWNLIANNYNGGAGPNSSYSWQVPNVSSTQCLIRVRDDADTLVKTDMSNATFTINQTTNVVVVVPNGTENWIAGTTQSIMYSVSGGVTNVMLEYSTNGGTSWTTITSSTNGGSFSWTIPNVYSTNALVRATDVSVACNSDVSNAPFTLTSQVAVTIPNGGEVFPATVGPQGSNWNMNSITETMNTGNFYDPGGPTGNYSYTGTTIVYKTFYPDVPINKLRVYFNSFSTVNSSDYLKIYNGPTSASPLLATLSGITAGNTYTSTHSTGALTFEWRANSGSVSSGWDAAMTSVGGTTTQNVTWSIIGTSQKYNLEYSTNNGTSWIRILTNYPSSTGTFAWQVPNTVSTNCLFKVMDNQNSTIVDQSNAVFTIGEPTPLLAVPNGGETWYSGQVQNILWSAPSFLNTLVKLEWSSDNGATWQLINANAPNNGSYAWTVPSTTVPLPVCLVRVSDATYSYKNDVSNAVFQIRPPVMIVSPNGPGGSTWQACTSSSITWTAGASTNYKIELSTDNGSTWSTVNASYTNGSANVNYPWSIPNTPSTQCLVRVTDNSNPLFTDTSDSTFTISPSIQVTYPNFGATIQSGTVTNITWINYNASNFYNIDYSTDGGSTWTNIVTNFNTTTQSYAWTVPSLSSSNCKVRVTDFTASCKSDVSDYAFTIQPSVPPVNITSPNGGESWAGCSIHNITWTTSGTSNLFNIEYSTNAGNTWNTIVTNYNTSTNTYAWTVPNVATAQALVRVTDATASTKPDVSNGVFAITEPVTAVVNPAGTVNICQGATVVLSSNATTGNLWSNGATTQTITVGSSGTYTVTVTNTGCSATSQPTTVVVNALPPTPTITAGGPTTFCAGGSVMLTSSAASGNSWLPGGQTTQQILVTASGNYSVQVTNAQGCSSTSNSTAVTVNPLPTAPTAGSNSPVNVGATINLTASTVSGATYSWTGPNGFTSTQQNPSITGATTNMSGTYTVTATVNGCTSIGATTVVNVQTLSGTSTLSGTIKHPNNTSTIRSTTVALSGTTTGSMVTGTNGQYSFTGLTSGGNYTLTPSKANDTTTNNGVTTLDLVLMQRHILNQDTLDSPYKILAADVNNSQTVTTLDIVLTRTVILQTSLTFPSGRLWYMVDASHTFPNAISPWPFPSTRTYPSVTTQTNQDFYGVKLGDVNWSWNPATSKTQTVGERFVSFGDFTGKKGDEVTIPVMAHDFDGIAGYQFTLNWDPSVLEYIGNEGMATAAHMGDSKVAQGALMVSWNDEAGGLVTLPDGATLFNLRFRVVGEAGTSTGISATSNTIAAEAYNSNLDVLEVKSRDGNFKVAGDQGAQAGGNTVQWYPSFPNPFSKETTIRFELPDTRQMQFTISDLRGTVVSQFAGVFEEGMHEIKWDGKSDEGRELAAGTYLLRIEAGSEVHNYRLIYVRE